MFVDAQIFTVERGESKEKKGSTVTTYPYGILWFTSLQIRQLKFKQ